MNGVKAFLTKTGPFGVPVYAYAIGLVALIGGVWYFRTHSSGSSTQAPQTNYPTSDNPNAPLPYPGAGSAPVPPSPAFIDQSQPQFADQSNFLPTAPPDLPTVPASRIGTDISPYDPMPQPTPPQATPSQIAAIVSLPFIGPIIGPIISSITSTAPPASLPPDRRARPGKQF